MKQLCKPFLVLGLVLPLAACSAALVAMTTPTPLVSMKESCARAETLIAELKLVPTPAEYTAAADKMAAIVAAGDQESKNAFTKLEDALRTCSTAKPGSEFLDADRHLLNTLDTMMSRCTAAGSSAFR